MAVGQPFVLRLLILILFGLSSSGWAGAQNVVYAPVQVSDTTDRPISHVILSAKGNASTSPPTDKAGKTHLVLPNSFVPGMAVSLVLVDTPDATLRFLSPWEGRAVIPLRDEVDVVLGVPGDPSMLNNARVRQAMRGAVAAKANGPGGPEKAIINVAAEVGLRPMDVDMALQKSAKKDSHMTNQHKASTGNSGTSSNTGMGMNKMSSKSHK